MRKQSDPLNCPESVSMSHFEQADGNCGWCGIRLMPSVPKPKLNPRVESELVSAYRYQWDPDY